MGVGGFVVLGIGFAASQGLPTHGGLLFLSWQVVAVLLILLGAALAAVGLYRFMTAPLAAERLTVSRTGLKLSSPSGSIEFDWYDAQHPLVIVDRRGLLRRNELPHASPEVEFILQPKLPIRAVIPVTAVRLIVREAQARGLKVHGWEEEAPPPGPARQIWIGPVSSD
jgi:hypothetical protein